MNKIISPPTDMIYIEMYEDISFSCHGLRVSCAYLLTFDGWLIDNLSLCTYYKRYRRIARDK